MPAAVHTEPAVPAGTRTAVAAYLRPVTIDDAIECLSRPGAVLIGGGTKANRRPSARRITIADLQALDLGRIEERPGGLLAIGATTTLQGLTGHPAVPPAVRETARREAPSTLRNLATVAGCVATSDPDSELLAVLLVHDAQVTLAGASGVRVADLAAVLTGRAPLDGRIITAVTIQTGGVTSVARTGRTAADRAIVAAIARRTPSGQLRLAVTGVAAAPRLLDLADGLGGAVGRLCPRGDFRGPGEYRRMLAGVLARRAFEEVGS